jgi:hypothetical protein
VLGSAADAARLQHARHLESSARRRPCRQSARWTSRRRCRRLSGKSSCRPSIFMNAADPAGHERARTAGPREHGGSPPRRSVQCLQRSVATTVDAVRQPVETISWPAPMLTTRLLGERAQLLAAARLRQPIDLRYREAVVRQLSYATVHPRVVPLCRVRQLAQLRVAGTAVQRTANSSDSAMARATLVRRSRWPAHDVVRLPPSSAFRPAGSRTRSTKNCCAEPLQRLLEASGSACVSCRSSTRRGRRSETAGGRATA